MTAPRSTVAKKVIMMMPVEAVHTQDEAARKALVTSLSQRYPRFADVTIQRWVDDAFDSFREAKVRTYVPILVQRRLDARLRELDRSTP